MKGIRDVDGLGWPRTALSASRRNFCCKTSGRGAHFYSDCFDCPPPKTRVKVQQQAVRRVRDYAFNILSPRGEAQWLRLITITAGLCAAVLRRGLKRESTYSAMQRRSSGVLARLGERYLIDWHL